MWAAKDSGSDINWANAKSYCKNYRGGGYTDWRMPTQDELASLYDRSCPLQKVCVLNFARLDLWPNMNIFPSTGDTGGIIKRVSI